jgi:adenine-specific DNA-methyltransferase
MKKSRSYEMEKQNRIYWSKDREEQPYEKVYLENSDGQLLNDFLDIQFGSNQEASLEIRVLI